jgi:hypothetical protein
MMWGGEGKRIMEAAGIFNVLRILYVIKEKQPY